MSCCGQKRSALTHPRTQAQPSAQEQPRPAPLRAVMLAFLARRAVSPRTGTGTATATGLQISRRRSR
jgi:hypothetical protein